MDFDRGNISMREYFTDRMKTIMMIAKTKEDLVVMEAMGIGDDHDRNHKSE